MPHPGPAQVVPADAGTPEKQNISTEVKDEAGKGPIHYSVDHNPKEGPSTVPQDGIAPPEPRQHSTTKRAETSQVLEGSKNIPAPNSEEERLKRGLAAMEEALITRLCRPCRAYAPEPGGEADQAFDDRDRLIAQTDFVAGIDDGSESNGSRVRQIAS